MLFSWVEIGFPGWCVKAGRNRKYFNWNISLHKYSADVGLAAAPFAPGHPSTSSDPSFWRNWCRHVVGAWPSRHQASEMVRRPPNRRGKDIPSGGDRTRPGGKSTSRTLQVHPTPRSPGLNPQSSGSIQSASPVPPTQATHDSEPIPPIRGSISPHASNQPRRMKSNQCN